jgi:hypothetical protein
MPKHNHGAGNPLAPRTYTRTTEIAVCLLPYDHEEFDHFAVKVVWRGGDFYGVFRMGQCVDKDGNWSYEPSVSSREDDWLAKHRFTLERALIIANTEAGKMEGRIVELGYLMPVSTSLKRRLTKEEYEQHRGSDIDA